MKLIRALHKSEHRAAILPLPTHLWSYVVVEHEYHVYTTEIHMYGRSGVLDFQIISYSRVNEFEIRRRLGDEFYFSDKWEPYANPTPKDILTQTKKIKQSMTPRKRKSLIPSDAEWNRLLESI